MNHTTNKTDLLNKVKEAVHSVVPEAEIILYGSHARGTAREDSDWDFLILLPLKIESDKHEKIKDCLYDLELETDTVISSLIRSKQEWMSARYSIIPIFQQIDKDGIRL
jgi:uncharacterized protein